MIYQHTVRHSMRCIRFVAAIVVVTILSLSLAAAAAPVVDTPVAPKSAPRSAASPLVPHIINPHLHGATPAVTTPTKSKQKSKVRHNHWSFSDWAVLHRGLGTITGEVHSGSGSPMAGIRVMLRSAKGKALAKTSSKHITHTNGGGTFVMKNVRIGTYRVRATKGKTAARSMVHVHGGLMSTVSVKL